MRTRCACLSTFCFSHTCTLFPVLVFIFHFYFYHQDIVNCSKVKQCMYFPFWKLASSSSIYFLLTDCSLSLSTPASVNWLAHTLDLPHFWQYSQSLIFVSISWPFSSRPLQIIDITDIFCQCTIDITDRAHFLQRFQCVFFVLFLIRFHGSRQESKFLHLTERILANLRNYCIFSRDL